MGKNTSSVRILYRHSTFLLEKIIVFLKTCTEKRKGTSEKSVCLCTFLKYLKVVLCLRGTAV